jgi:KaiC/GvpD/RAD55 family RecA-like ATPase
VLAASDANIIQAVGSMRKAIDLCIDLDRELWQLPGPLALGDARNREGSDLAEAAQKVVERRKVDDAIAHLIVEQIKARYCSSEDEAHATIEKRVLLQRPTTIAAAVLPDVRFHDIQYCARRNIRGHFARSSPSGLIVPFQSMARPLNLFLESRGKRRTLRTPVETLSELLRKGLRATALPPEEFSRYAGLFTECSRSVGYVFPGYRGTEIIVDTSEFDVEFLLTHLFGCPTAIPGFDELFGGGGLVLAERSSWDHKPSEGRAILIKGRFGSGKSMLALQLCAEVARKGGAARFVAMEQTAADCRYMLDSIGAIEGLSDVEVVTDGATFGRKLAHANRDIYSPGLLAVLDGINDSTEDFLSSLELDSQVSRQAALSLIVVDPINAVHRLQSSTANQELRADFVHAIQKVKAQGTNILFVAEEDTEHPAAALFEENIVDTVIRLSEARSHGYSRRSFEVQKSRLQRECRGLHWYSIRSGEGIHIYPSSAAVYNRIRRRRIPLPGTVGGRNAFGLPEFDDVLGADAFYRGDVIAFSGSTGSLKTQLGFSFLLNGDFKPGRDKMDEHAHKSLLVAAREPAESLHFQLTAPWAANYLKRMRELQRQATAGLWFVG